MEVVKRGYGLFGVVMTQSEVDDFETACREESRLSESVLQELLDKFLTAVRSVGIGGWEDGT